MKPSRLCIIIKLVGKTIGYRYVLHRLEMMWKIEHNFSLTDLPNGFFIAEFTHRSDCDTALFNGHWMIFDHYLHVQQWVPNFTENDAQINFLPVWVRFPILPVEYYSTHWHVRAEKQTGKMLKVVDTTFNVSREKYARVCVEIDLTKPFMTGYRLKKKLWRLQHEGLHNICFHCRRYGHMGTACPQVISMEPSGNDEISRAIRGGHVNGRKALRLLHRGMKG